MLGNITTLAVHGLPTGRGHKGGVLKRQRSKTVTSPDLVVPRPATCKRLTSSTGCTLSSKSNGSDSHTPSTTSGTSKIIHSFVGTNIPGAGESNTFQSLPNNYLPGASSQPFNVSQSASGISALASTTGSFVSQSQVITFQSPKPSTNTNPFFLRVIEGNIRMCQGCKTSLRNIDGSIPLAPYDFAIARFEGRSFRDKNEEIQTPMREQAVHYHLKLACVMVVCPDFVASRLFGCCLVVLYHSKKNAIHHSSQQLQ